jgi:glycosidase
VAAETVDVAQLARHTRVDKFPSVLDFAFARAVEETVAGKSGTTVLARMYADDGLYEGGVPAALRLPTFTGNHDFGRFAHLVQRARPGIGNDEALRRVMLSNAMLFLLRGVPVVYYGDEQGFAGHGIDQASRQDMFASQVASYNDQALLGTDSTTARANFDALHPLYRQISALASLRKQYVELRRGRQIVRVQSREPGLFAASRIGADGRELLVAFNTSLVPVKARVEIEPDTRALKSLVGDCAAPDAPGSVQLTLPALGYVACVETAP